MTLVEAKTHQIPEELGLQFSKWKEYSPHKHMFDKWLFSDVAHSAEINVIRTIFLNIIEEPHNEKHRNINYNVLFTKINQCKTCLSFLYKFGFEINNDIATQPMLTLDQQHINQLTNDIVWFNGEIHTDQYNFRQHWNTSIGQISLKNNKKQLDLLFNEIFKNILDNPQDKKFRDLNFEKTCKKFIPCKSCVIMLFAAGFKKNKNRLKFDVGDINQLRTVNDALQSKIFEMEQNSCNNDSTIKQITNICITELSCFSLLSPAGHCNCPFCGRELIKTNLIAQRNSIYMCSRCTVVLQQGDVCFECIKQSNNVYDTAVRDHTYSVCEECWSTIQQKVSHHSNLITMNECVNIDGLVEYIMGMGFSRNAVLNAIEISKLEINLALSYLIYRTLPPQTQFVMNIVESDTLTAPPERNLASVKKIYDVSCNGLLNCSAFLRLKKILKSYSENKIDIETVEIQLLLNDYHHLLQEHSSNKEFEQIALLLGQCNTSKCLKLQRTYRNRSVEDEIKIEYSQSCSKTTARCQILDKIHTHFYHCYDMGYKLRQKERNKIQNRNDSIYRNEQLLECTNINTIHINNMLSSNRKLHSKVQNQERVHKFKQLSDSDIVNDEKVNNHNYDIYSYGLKFYYWKYYQHSHKYIKKKNYPKYTSFKEELLHNATARIGCQQFKYEMHKASLHITTQCCRKRIAKPNYISTTYWGIQNNDAITVIHLVAVLIYCNYDGVQYEFSKTFRRIYPNECVASVKMRNAEFFYFTKLLYETVNIYGIICGGNENRIKRFYHGINKEMLFDSLSCNISSPFSTTSSFAVAVHFSKNVGMILELSAHAFLKYWNCSWLSDFGNENEKLFIGGFYPFSFVNIIQPSKGLDHSKYASCLSIIDQLMTDYDFLSEQEMQDVNTLHPSGLVGEDMHLSLEQVNYLNEKKTHSISTQYLTRCLIMNELNRGNNNLKDKRKMKLIKINAKKTNPYIQTLFHHICVTRKQVIINTILFNQTAKISGCSFLKTIFCLENKDGSNGIWINLNVLSVLYPNLECIKLRYGAIESLSWLHHVWEFLWHQKQYKSTKIGYIAIKFTALSDLKSICSVLVKYIPSFNKIGFDILIQQEMIVTIVNKEYDGNYETENDENTLLWMDDGDKIITFQKDHIRNSSTVSIKRKNRT
eukprot:98212_1